MIITKITASELVNQLENGNWQANKNGTIEQARQFINEIGITRLDNLKVSDPLSDELGTLDFSDSLVLSVAGLIKVIA